MCLASALALILAGAAFCGAVEPAVVFHGKAPWTPYDYATVARKDGSLIDVYVIRHSEEPRPALVVLSGSPCLPLFMMEGKRRVSPLMFQADLPRVSERVSVVVIERRGLKSFGKPPKGSQDALRFSQCTPTRGGVKKSDRVDDAARVVEALSRAPWVSQVHIVGHSEGSEVAAGMARALNGRGIASLGLMSGASVGRFFEEALSARGDEGAAGAARALRDMIALTGPNPPKDYDGRPAAYQITYGVDSTPVEDLKGLRIPVFVAAGDSDAHVPVAAADAFVAEMLRDRGQAVHYLMLPGLDHGYVAKDGKDRSGGVLSAYLDWALAGHDDRAVAIGLSER